MAAATALVGVPPNARFSYWPVSVLSEIAPEHIREIVYHDCFDTSMAAVGSNDAIFVIAAAGRRLSGERRQLRARRTDALRK